MRETLHFLELHGPLVVFAAVLCEQVGVPIPAAPVLLAAGALAGSGSFSATLIIILGTIASLIGDIIWYVLGWRKGQSILNLLCKISLEPDSCVGNTKSLFSKLGSSSLVVAKFVPGLSTAAPPLAGATRMKLWRFLLFDLAGSALWAGGFVLLGFLFSRELERVMEQMARFGSMAALVLFVALGSYLGWKFWQRERFIRSLRASRIMPEDLLARICAGEPVTIIDLRHSLELGPEPMQLPGARWYDRKELETRHGEIPLDQDIILYCT